MSPKARGRDPILRRTATGFAVVIVISWLVEIFHVPHLLFGDAPTFNWARVLLRTAVLIAVWAWVHWTTRRLLERLHRLEEFLLVCSWCRKVGHEGTWLTIEDYFGSNFATQTSHGICPECAAHQRSNHIKADDVLVK